MKSKKRLSLAIAILLILSIFTGCGNQESASMEEEIGDLGRYSAYLDYADVNYAYDIAYKLTTELEFFNNPELGGRNSGSDAEHKVADFLATEMESIGLQDVSKDEFSAVKWQFNSSELTILTPEGESKVLKPYSYASGATPAEGITAELVYVGEGTMYDSENIDVEGKVVLVDINQRENWWVTYPTLEAAFHGAAAIINNNVGGFAELNDDTMNCQDMCGPVTIPSLNISRNDANYLKSLLENNEVTINLKVDNVVEEDGTSYNIVGKIPGKSDEMIIIGDHYDVHFWGFQDNNCAVGLTLAIAKGLIDSGYEPERTLVFVLHGAEEYGAIDVPSDWSIGAWNQINKVRPEWVGKTLAYINFELPAFEFSESVHVASTPELYSFIKDFAATSPQPEGCYPGGILTDGYQQFTYSDDWSYTAAGVPGMINGFLITPDGEDVYNFYYTTYHSQFDAPDTYNENVLDFNLRFYGSMAIALDQTPGLELNFVHQADRIMDSVDENAFALAGIDTASMDTAIDAFGETAHNTYNQMKQLNELYDQLKENDADEELLAKIWDSSVAANEINLKVFKMMQDNFLMLGGADCETPVVGHEQYQNNITALDESILKLQEGDVNYVVDELLWQVDDEWYAYSFSKEVFDHVVSQTERHDNLFWATGKLLEGVDLYDTTQSLMNKYDMDGEDFVEEISALQSALDSQKSFMAAIVEDEIEALNTMAEELRQVDLSGIIEEAEASLE